MGLRLIFACCSIAARLCIAEPIVYAEIEQELDRVPLQSRGTIPQWLKGTYIRNGPVNVMIGGQALAHWFDGPAMLHAFEINQGQVIYSNRFLKTLAYEKIFKEKSFDYKGFDCGILTTHSVFKKFWYLLTSPPADTAYNNANVNVWEYDQQFVALTEIPLPICFDLKNLNTLGLFVYNDPLPKNWCWETAHPHRDLERKENINLLAQFGFKNYYILYRIKDGSKEREIISKIPVDEPSYMHTFAVTDNYIILAQYPLVVRPIDFILKNKPFIQNYKWKPEKGTVFLVINRQTGDVVTTVNAPAFFAWHHINAFEKDGEIVMDIITYPNPSIIYGLAKERRDTWTDFEQTLVRYRLSLETKTVQSETIFKKFIEYPRINDLYERKPYRFFYATDPRNYAEYEGKKIPATDVRPLYKVDMETHQILSWEEPGCCWCGEPIFIPAPEAIREDEGVVMVIVSDDLTKKSYLLLLDGETFQEIGRAFVPHEIPPGLHGRFF